MLSPTPFFPTASPHTNSPDISKVKASTKRSASNNIRRKNVRTLNAQVQKKQKVTISAKSSMFIFLRNEYVSAYAESHAKMENGFDTSHIMKAAINNWKWSSAKFYWKPFLKLKSVLKDAREPMTTSHTRMFLEDFMLCVPGETVMCLISPNHHFFLGRRQSTWIAQMEESLTMDPLKPVQFSGRAFFPLTMTTQSNSTLAALESGTMTTDEVQYLCTKEGGGGINFLMCNNVSKLIKFHELLENNDSIQFWSTKTTQRLRLLMIFVR
jgi:hypothetical protein